VLLCGCQSAYYAAWEKLGKEKRHLLKDEVGKVRAEQAEAADGFEDVLTRIKALYGLQGGDLEKVYDRLKDDYERSRERAEAVDDRIGKVKRIAADLFQEWSDEIGKMENENLKEKSRRSLSEARRRFARLDQAMDRARSSMQPVLIHLRDYVLYLKHNLNARAVGALGGEVRDIEAEVATLVADMGRSVREAETFLREFE